MLSASKFTKGFTYLELVIVIIIISTLVYFALDRLLRLQVDAEKAAVDQTVGSIQSALALVISEHIAKDKLPELRQYLDKNPMSLLAQQPTTYQGSFNQPPANLPKGSWYYRTDTKQLIYLVENTDYISNLNNHLALIAFKVFPVYDDNNRNGRFDAGDTLKGLTLKSLQPYHWLREPRGSVTAQ